MSDLTLNIADLKAKIEKLVTLHKSFKEENEKLALEVSELKNTVQAQLVSIQNLEKENKELIVKQEEEKENILTNTKEKINELVQEIDDCIALLNK